ncbi:MFS transporter [Kluyvera georgiana]|nr:MFS transporter [Kluyvera georgiana]
MYEKIGFADTYLLMGGTVLLFTIISAVLLKNNQSSARFTLNTEHS